MTVVALAPQPILQFLDNSGAPAAGGSVLTQVGGVNQTTWQDSGATTPLPNPIPLNSRGEISNASGVSCQLFLQVGVAYTFTLFDKHGHQLNQASYTAAAGVSLRSVDVLQYGADPSGLTDSTTAFANACTSLGALGGTVSVPSGKYLIGSNLTIPASVTLKGPYDFTGSNGNNSSYNYGTMSAIMLSSGATITQGSGSCITGHLIYQSGLTFPQNNTSAYAGTAVTFNGDDCTCHNNMILGFAQAILSVGCQRPAIYWNKIDSLNGIKVAQDFDVGRVHNNHCWPFATVGGSGNPAAASRSGVAYQIGDGTSDSADFLVAVDNFEFAYQTGFLIDDSSAVVLVNPQCDYTNNFSTTSIGLNFTGTGNNAVVLGGVISWQGTGVVVNVSAPANDSVRMYGTSIFNPQNTNGGSGTICAQVLNGRLEAIGCTFSNAAYGIDAHTAGQGITSSDCDYDTITTEAHFVAAGGEQLSNIWNNRYLNGTPTAIPEQKFINEVPTFIINVFGTAGGYHHAYQYARGTQASPVAVQTNDVLMSLSGSGYDGTSYRSVTGLRAQVQGTVSGTSVPTVLLLSATPSGSNALVDEVGINGAALYPITDNAISSGLSTNRWSVVYAATGTINTSDARLKTDVRPLKGTDFINLLKPVSYRWISGGKEVIRQVFRDDKGDEVAEGTKGARPAEIISKEVPGKRAHYGFLAQDVKTALAGADVGLHVLSDPNDPDSEQGLRYEELIAPMVAAIQELTARVKALESKS